MINKNKKKKQTFFAYIDHFKKVPYSFIYLFVCLFVCLFIHLFIYLFIYLFFQTSIVKMNTKMRVESILILSSFWWYLDI